MSANLVSCVTTTETASPTAHMSRRSATSSCRCSCPATDLTGQKIAGRGYVQITGLAWSGGGAVSKVDVSADGGRSWKEAKLQAPVLPKAHTRFTFDWAWDGQEAVIQSRCTDDQGEVQPSVAELYKDWGIAGEEAKKAVRTTHFNAMQPWKVASDGSISNAMFA
jgi:sulfane dehydrogenase subunit SoxC